MRVPTIQVKPIAVVIIVIVVGFFTWQFLAHLTTATEPELRRLAERYVKAIYARDFAAAYQTLAARDREAKSVETYVKEQGAFTGFTAELAAKLATFVEVAADRPTVSGDRATMTTRLKLPDVEKLSPLVLGWDEQKLNALSSDKQAALLAAIDARQQKAELPFVQTDEKLEFVRENNRWQLWLNWRAGVQVDVQVKLPAGAPLDVAPINSPLNFQPGEPFTIALKLKNPTDKELRARVMHNVEPKNLEKYLGVGDCGTFVPFRMAAGKEEENNTTFLVWTNLPAEIKRFTMIYEFEVDQQASKR